MAEQVVMIAHRKWRNSIVTLLVGGPMKREAIHGALLPLPNAEEAAQIDKCLSEMVKQGDLRRPFRGYYEIARRRDP